VDLVTLDPGGIVKRFGDGDYDSIYFGIQASSTIRRSTWTSAQLRSTISEPASGCWRRHGRNGSTS
jgi:hypothetical protein